MLTTTMLACDCPKIVAPAMNTRMYENPVTQDNIRKLEEYGMTIAFPTSGHLACGDIGKGKMLEPEELFQYILMACAFEKDMAGKHVLVTAGATQEALDPVRYITNHSSGKMGYSLAKISAFRGSYREKRVGRYYYQGSGGSGLQTCNCQLGKDQEVG